MTAVKVGAYIAQIHQGINFINEDCAGSRIKFDMNLRIWFLGIAIMTLPPLMIKGYRNRNWQQIIGSVVVTGMAIAAIKSIHDWALPASIHCKKIASCSS